MAYKKKELGRVSLLLSLRPLWLTGTSRQEKEPEQSIILTCPLDLLSSRDRAISSL